MVVILINQYHLKLTLPQCLNHSQTAQSATYHYYSLSLSAFNFCSHALFNSILV